MNALYLTHSQSLSLLGHSYVIRRFRQLGHQKLLKVFISYRGEPYFWWASGLACEPNRLYNGSFKERPLRLPARGSLVCIAFAPGA